MGRLQTTVFESNGYTCKYCNLYNDILNFHCKYCNGYRPKIYDETHLAVFNRRGLNEVIEWIDIMSDSSKIDKFQNFFNSGKILYSSMPFEKRREWRDELAEILMTARANLSAADWVDREESARLTPDGRQWLESNTEDSANLLAPKLRKERMSKADKLREQMTSLGLDMKDVKSIMSTVERVTRDKDMNNLVFRKNGESEKDKPILSELCRIGEHIVCTGSFRDDNGSHECNCDCHKVKKIPIDDSDKPNPAVFDASSLKFGG